MSETPDFHVPCPVCGVGSVAVYVDWGERVSYATGGGQGVTVDDIDPDCPCYRSGLVIEDKYREAVEEAALEVRFV